MKRIYADINPDVLAWARERARFSPGELARKIGVQPERYLEWEAGERKPTLRQLTDLVQALNRSLQLFYLSQVPDEPEMLAEMRRLPGSPFGEESPELAEQVELASTRRETTLRLFKAIGEQPPELGLMATLKDNPDEVAAAVRDTIGITTDRQTEWTDEYQALREWRTALEEVGVLLFQIPGVSIKEMRGFSIAFHPLPVIGFNSRDWPRGRVFTIFHELTHILLRETFLDTPQHDWFQLDARSDVERFSNRVAASILLPLDHFHKQASFIVPSSTKTWRDEDVTQLSARYKVSKAVIVRRLSELELITPSSYQELSSKYERGPRDRPDPSGGNFYSNKIAHYGTLFPRVAFRAYYADQATVSDLSLLLGMKAKNLAKFEERVIGYSYGFGGK